MFKILKKIKTEGAVKPSGYTLVSEMVGILEYTGKTGGRRILEIGGGNGVITEEIIKKMTDKDILFVVEIEKNNFEKLKKRFANIDSVILLNDDILNIGYGDFDFVICSLPFNLINNEINKKIRKKINEITKDNALMSYFEYLFFRKIRRGFKIQRKKYNKNLLSRVVIYKNTPPAICNYISLSS
tara:strand:- start:1674 stop:2228 length:555 start_codon:yes stop_codon:yes gene_type:complete